MKGFWDLSSMPTSEATTPQLCVSSLKLITMGLMLLLNVNQRILTRCCRETPNWLHAENTAMYLITKIVRLGTTVFRTLGTDCDRAAKAVRIPACCPRFCS